jgi:hypothetical protein
MAMLLWDFGPCVFHQYTHIYLLQYAGTKEERRYRSNSLLTSALDGGEWSVSCPGCALPPGRTPGTHCIGGWVGLRAGLDTAARGKSFSSARD